MAVLPCFERLLCSRLLKLTWLFLKHPSCWLKGQRYQDNARGMEQKQWPRHWVTYGWHLLSKPLWNPVFRRRKKNVIEPCWNINNLIKLCHSSLIQIQGDYRYEMDFTPAKYKKKKQKITRVKLLVTSVKVRWFSASPSKNHFSLCSRDHSETPQVLWMKGAPLTASLISASKTSKHL